MQPAPTLPSVMDEDWVAARPRESSATPSMEGAAFASPSAPLASTPFEPDPAIRLWQQQVQQLGQLHQEFVSSQAQVHRRFLALRQGMQHHAEALGLAAVPPTSSAQPVMRSNSSSEASAVVIETSSTFGN